jgi:hypothetical protein
VGDDRRRESGLRSAIYRRGDRGVPTRTARGCRAVGGGTGGSKTEIIGGAIDNLGEVYDVAQGPAADVSDSFFSVVVPGTLRNGGTWGYLLRDTYPSGQTNLYADDLVTLFTSPQGEERIVLPLYVTPGYR